MKCPLLTPYAVTFRTPQEYQDRDCLGRYCAWWDKGEKACFIQVWTAQMYETNKLLELTRGAIKAAGPMHL